MNNNRDVAADYKAALIAEYWGYRNAGRDVEAKHVAELLLTMHDHDMGAEKAVEPPAPLERAVPDKTETETPESDEPPVKRGPGRPRKNPAAE